MSEFYYQAKNATVKGDVTFSEEDSIWYQAVIRTESAPIVIGSRTNIQDACVIHTDANFPVTIGEDVTIGHGAIIHGALIGSHCLIGMGAILLNGCKVGKNSLVAAGSLLLENRQYPEGSLIAGSPAKVMRTLTEEEIQSIRQNAAHYVLEAEAQLPKIMLKTAHS